MIERPSPEDLDRTVWDVVIVGAGPAGAFLAYLLSREGQRILLVDQQSFPRDKVCGGCLNGSAWKLLHGAGLSRLTTHLEAVELTSLSFCDSRRQVTTKLTGMRAIARRELDFALVNAAVDQGARWASPYRASVLPARDSRFRDVELTDRCQSRLNETRVVRLQARVVVLAAGLSHAALSASRELAQRVQRDSRVGVAVTCSDSTCDALVPPHQLTLAIDRGAYAGLVRLADGQLHCAGAVPPGLLKACGGPAAWLSSTLAATGLTTKLDFAASHWFGAPSLTRRVCQPAAHRLLAIGDAAGYVEPFTGEGMAWAMESALAALPFVIAERHDWSPHAANQWRRELRRRFGARQRACHWIAQLVSHPLAVRASLATLAACPPLTHFLVRRFSTTAV